MFSQVSVCPQGRVSAPFHAGIHPPGPEADIPPGQTPPEADTPPRQTTLGRQPPGQIPPEQTSSGQTHPWADISPMQYMLGYSQQTGGTHPTGMHSCYGCFQILTSIDRIFDRSCVNLPSQVAPIISGINPLRLL